MFPPHTKIVLILVENNLYTEQDQEREHTQVDRRARVLRQKMPVTIKKSCYKSCRHFIKLEFEIEA